MNFSGVNDSAEIFHEIFALFHNFVILYEKFCKKNSSSLSGTMTPLKLFRGGQ
jgi:hypothetical protein